MIKDINTSKIKEFKFKIAEFFYKEIHISINQYDSKLITIIENLFQKNSVNRVKYWGLF